MARYWDGGATPPTMSPWGEVQFAKILAPGIVLVDTAGHGGVGLSEARIAEMPEDARTGDGWYEEDGEEDQDRRAVTH